MTGFDVVDPRYRTLYDRAVDVLSADPRVERVVLAGSVASGDADQWSDLDVNVFVSDESYQAFVDDWMNWLNRVTPTVFARRPLGSHIVNAVSAEGLGFDVIVLTREQPSPRRPVGFAVGMLARERFADPVAAVEYAVQEQLRGLAGPLLKFLKRGQLVELFMGLGHTFGLLTTIVLVERDEPAPARGVPGDLPSDVVAALPAVRPTFDSLLEFQLAVAREVVTRGRRLFDRFGLDWPSALEAVAARRLHEAFGVDTGEWLRDE